jgi:hypothetical protein
LYARRINNFSASSGDKRVSSTTRFRDKPGGFLDVASELSTLAFVETEVSQQFFPMDALNSSIVLLLVILNGKTMKKTLNIVFGLGGFLNY